MARRFIRPDAVALAGSIVGIVSLLFGWLTLKPNRLAAGDSIGLWNSFGTGAAISLICLWLVCFALSLVKWRWQGIGAGIASSVIIIVTGFFTGLGSRQLLEGAPEIYRVSLGVGVWLTLAAAYVVLFASRQALQSGGKPARVLLSWAGAIGIVVLLISGWLDTVSIMVEYDGYRERFWQESLQHVRLFGFSVIVATIVGVALGVWASRNRFAERPVFFVTNMVQTIPSLALFGLLIAPLSALSFAFPVLREAGIRGVGTTPAIIALTAYSLLPVVQNTYTGLRQVDRGAIDAGTGMGMSRWQVFRKVEVPLAAPLVLEGVRTASVQAVGLTAVAALIGAGGLGWFVLRGIGQAAPDLIILGVIPIIALALIIDSVMRGIVRLGTARGLRLTRI